MTHIIVGIVSDTSPIYGTEHFPKKLRNYGALLPKITGALISLHFVFISFGQSMPYVLTWDRINVFLSQFFIHMNDGLALFLYVSRRNFFFKKHNMVHDDHVTMVYFLCCVSNFINEGMYRNKYIILLL